MSGRSGVLILHFTSSVIFLFLAHLSHQLVRELYFLFVLWIFVDKVLEL